MNDARAWDPGDVPDVRWIRPPSGWFHARSVRDATARVRDGEPFYAANRLPSEHTETFEILFGDGAWMLASEEDLEWRVEGKPET